MLSLLRWEYTCLNRSGFFRSLYRAFQFYFSSKLLPSIFILELQLRGYTDCWLYFKLRFILNKIMTIFSRLIDLIDWSNLIRLFNCRNPSRYWLGTGQRSVSLRCDNTLRFVLILLVFIAISLKTSLQMVSFFLSSWKVDRHLVSW